MDTDPFPYHHARIHYTGYPVVTITGVESEGAKTAQGSASITKHAYRWKQV